MEILSSAKKLSKMDVYRLTNGNGNSKMQTLAGTRVEFVNWAYVTDINKRTGEMVDKVFIEVDGVIYGTISQSFITTFVDFVSLFPDAHSYTIDIFERETKNGRRCLLCLGAGVSSVGGESDEA